MTALPLALIASDAWFADPASPPARQPQPQLLHGDGKGPMARLLRVGGLYPVFQPIVDLGTASIFAHEALIRGPKGSALHTPDALLRAARQEQLSFEFEYACVEVILRAWGSRDVPGRLFVNFSAQTLTRLIAAQGSSRLLELLDGLGVKARMLVLELTEHERVEDVGSLIAAVAALRAAGVSLALDDFGDGHSSLRLWSELKPEVVKIDKYFTSAISQHGAKFKTVQALLQIADIFGTALVAEGVETQEELRVLRDVGVDYGQGYFLGHPANAPLRYLGVDAQRVLAERQIVVFPELKRASGACPNFCV